MEFEIVEAEGGRFAEGRPGVLLVKEEGDALDLLSEAGQRGVRRILLHAENLSPDFFELTTGLAGAVFQKFSNYSIRAALLVDPRKIRSRRFRELMMECGRGGDIRFFEDREAAQRWLLGRPS